MAELYRKSALERISSPDQLDKSIKVTSRMSWLALVGITIVIVIAVVWSIYGSIPVTMNAQGIITPPSSTNAIYAQESGTVVSVNVSNGDEIKKEDTVLTYKTSDGTIKEVKSDQDGIVTNINVETEYAFYHGQDMIRIAPATNDKQVVVCYVPLAYVTNLEEGMRVQISMTSVDSQSLGHIEAYISNIDSFASSSEGMAYVIGYGNGLDSMFLANGAVAAVTCILEKDDTTESGFKLSNKNGSHVTIANGTIVTAKMILDEVPPITKLFTNLLEVLGD